MLCAHINLMPKALGPWRSSQITLATRELGWSLLPPHPRVCVCSRHLFPLRGFHQHVGILSPKCTR